MQAAVRSCTDSDSASLTNSRAPDRSITHCCSAPCTWALLEYPTLQAESAPFGLLAIDAQHRHRAAVGRNDNAVRHQVGGFLLMRDLEGTVQVGFLSASAPGPNMQASQLTHFEVIYSSRSKWRRGTSLSAGFGIRRIWGDAISARITSVRN